ncbi:MAG: hypothetical protein JWO08_1881 [Verrucomicrobiaceae bacterium]|nr:hypothetical protein [Verrucomicrobiaceae bacterium]
MEQNLLQVLGMDKLPPELQPLIVPVGIIVGLLIIAMIRIVFLLRTNKRLMLQAAKMENQVLNQQREVISVRQDANAWRGAMQVQLDAFRAESSRRLEDAEIHHEQAMKQYEIRLRDLQGLLAKAMQPPAPPPAPVEPRPPSPPPPIFRAPNSVPRLPADVPGMLNDVVLPSFDEVK